jgi:hypothetical protein
MALAGGAGHGHERRRAGLTPRLEGPSGAELSGAIGGTAPAGPTPRPALQWAAQFFRERRLAMSYSKRITRANPTCVLFLIDQSGSMADPFPQGEVSGPKASFLADVINRFLMDQVLRCTVGDEIRDWFYVGVLAYGDNSVRAGFGGALSGRQLVSISDVGNNPTRVEERAKKEPDGAGGLVEVMVKFPIWFDAVASGNTPMSKAFQEAHGILQSWLSQHADCFPPIVIHVTDGESTDGDPSGAMESVKQLSSSDGNVLLFNVHISSTHAQPVIFPDSPSGLPDQYALMLFNSASPLISPMRTLAAQTGRNVTDGAKGFVLNARPTHIIEALSIGTVTLTTQTAGDR